MSPEQCRAARGLLGWSQEDLARAADISPTTVRTFEKAQRDPIRNVLAAIRRAFEGADIQFIGGDRPGVRWATPRHMKDPEHDDD